MLRGLRVLDLSRILAGPSATQLLADLGADVIKVERPGRGDDTRGWGPPFASRADGSRGQAAYYEAANRNKRSIAIDVSTTEGAELVRELARVSDVFVENYKVGDLARRGLGYADLQAIRPSIVYCSITGFGQDGPRAAQPGYDFLAQAMGGLMSVTGPPEGPPMKVGVGVADLFCGMYAAVAILGALRHRDQTGEGQHLDLALFDTQLAWLANTATDFLMTGVTPPRLGNAHPHIVPYEVFATADGFLVLAVGNDAQFERLARLQGHPKLAADVRFATNAARVEHRATLVPMVGAWLRERTTAEWIAVLGDAKIPCGPVNDLRSAFDDPQARHRQMTVSLERADGTVARLVANPIKASRTPPTHRLAPPQLGANGREVLRDLLGISDSRAAELEQAGVLGRAAQSDTP